MLYELKHRMSTVVHNSDLWAKTENVYYGVLCVYYVFTMVD